METYTAGRHQEDGVGSKEGEEGLSAGDDLPRDTERGHEGAEDLTTDDVDPARPQTRHICTDRQRVRAGVGTDDGKNHTLSQQNLGQLSYSR